ncbi:unnamed protein product [Polarella glacialis]|nr:unnamed protein product [Polarella glacialis]
MDLAAAHVAFAHFGELQSLKLISGFSSLAEVVFFDIRAASAALEALGSEACVPGQQVGDRTVQLAGDAEPDMNDLSRISDVRTTPAGSLVLDFFDVRDATGYGQADPEGSASAWIEAGLRAKVEEPPQKQQRRRLPRPQGSGLGLGERRRLRRRRLLQETLPCLEAAYREGT